MKKIRVFAVILLIVPAISGCSAGQTSGSPQTTMSIQEESENPSGQAAVSEHNEPADQTISQEPEQTTPLEPEQTAEEIPQTITILGTEYDINTSELDLSECTSDDIEEITSAICDMPELEKVNLMDEEDYSALTLTDIKQLQDAAPNVKFIYRFDLFGQRIALSDTVIRFKKADIGNEGEETIRQALSVLNKCTYFVLDDCGIDNEIMAQIRDDFPNTKVVWRIHVGRRSALTDDTVIRMTHGVDDSVTEPLKYCNEVVYMDLGHDGGITEISYTANMPNLECLILSESRVSDLTPLTNCPNLTWLELCYCGKLNDISVVSELENLKFLNISYSKVRDISPVTEMKLDRFCCIGNQIPKETIDEFKETHPDCMCSFSGSPWGYAWRYDDYGYHFFSYYERMREVFRYDWEAGGQRGFKFPEYEEPENEMDEDFIFE